MSTITDSQPKAEEMAIEKKLDAMDLEPTETTPAPETTVPSTEPPSSPASFKEKPTCALKTPISDPVEAAKPIVRPDLSPEQQAMYDALLATIKEWKDVPSSTGKAGPIVDEETMWLTRDCLLRYLRATKWSTKEAAKRLLETLSWRRDFGIESLTDGELVSTENETGKQILLGYDKAARPCIYLSPGRQNTQPSPRQIQQLVFTIERAIELMTPGQETLALLINFKQSKDRSNTAPGIAQGREALNILQTHYPERLGRACIINIPWVVWGFFKLITPFIDPLTREKLKFNEDVRNYVPPEQLWKEFNGNLDFEYDHAAYWPALNKLCGERRAEWKARWEKAGKRYGESEKYLKGGDSALEIQASSTLIQGGECAPVN